MLRLAVLAMCMGTSAAQTIAGYVVDEQVGGSVKDHNSLDLDTKKMSEYISKYKEAGAAGGEAAFVAARAMYAAGGHSRAVATFTVPALSAAVAKGGAVTQAAKAKATGKVYKPAKAGATSVKVKYSSTCKQGGLKAADQDVTGCFDASAIKIDGTTTLSPSAVANGYRTLKGFSVGGDAKMKKEPYFIQYSSYYGAAQYAHEITDMALTKTGFFASVPYAGRKEGAMKGAVYLNVWMYTIHEMEDAIDDCQGGCLKCNDSPVHAWDEAVAFYTGTLEGEDGSGSGVHLYALAEKRCKNYNTCVDGMKGKAKVNEEIMELFKIGAKLLNEGKCSPVIAVKNAIVQKMAVPMIQGALRYSYKLDNPATTDTSGKTLAEGYIFSRAVLPMVSACRRTDAAKIASDLDIAKINAQDTLKGKHAGVKKAFEDNFECMNITCTDIGSLSNDDGTIKEGAGACTFKIAYEQKDTVMPAWGMGVIVACAAAAVIFMLTACYCRQQKKKYLDLYAELSPDKKGGAGN